MNLLRWQRKILPAANHLADFGNELDQWLETPFNRASEFLRSWTPALDVHEDKDSFIVRAELPGLKREDIEVSIHEGTLIISGERKNENKAGKASAHRTERFYGKFQRAVALPVAVAAEKVTAQYKDGVLTVTLPKAEEAKPKQININVN